MTPASLATARPVWLIFAATLFAGCLPSSCQREESRLLFAADSLSRAHAEALPVDTLELVFETSTDPAVFSLPRTLAFDDNGGLVVSDAEANQIVELSAEGRVAARHELGSGAAPGGIPYIVGLSADTVYVFSAGDNTITGLVDGRRTLHFALDQADAARQLRYVVAGDTGVWVKSVDPDSGSVAVRYRWDGTRTAPTALRGPYWAHAGVLRSSGDSVLSIRGYMPVVNVIDATGQIDSVRLRGFDSPMLARMRSFQLGKTKSPPLLIPSAAYDGERFYVINARPGWLRIDVYDASMSLQAILVEPTPGYNKSFYPTDIAVRTEAGRILLAVSMQEPEPSIRVFAWEPDEGPAPILGRSGPSK
jgi:hypothetical protein